MFLAGVVLAVHAKVIHAVMHALIKCGGVGREWPGRQETGVR